MTSNTDAIFSHLFEGLPDDWVITPLPEVVDFQEGPGILAKDFRESGVPLLRLSCISGPVTTFDGCNYLDPEKVEKKWSHFKLKEGDILLSTSGSLGRVSVVDKEQEGSICYTGIIRFRPKVANLRPSFIKYFLQSKDFEHQALASAAGSVLKHFGPTHLKKMSFPVPPENYQLFVEDQLNPIDSKIELNRKANQTLEQIAQAIFKSWFVDFDPVRAKIAAREAFIQQHPEVTEEAIRAAAGTEGDTLAHAGAKACELAAICAISGKNEEQLKELSADALQQLKTTAALFPDALEDSDLGEVPEGWGCTEITDIADVIKGKSYKSSELDSSKVALVTLKSFMRGGGYRLDGLKEYTGTYKPEQEVYAGDLIVAYTDVTQAADVIGKPAMVIGDSRYEHLVISLDVAVVRPKNDGHKYFLYGLAKTVRFQDHTLAHTTGTTVLHLGKDAVPKFVFAKPNDNLLAEYQRIAAPLFSSINERIAESSGLAMIRDVVLPKLLSGDMEVSNAS